MGASGAAGGESLASIGLSAYSTILQSQGVANADEYQAAKLDQSAKYGELKAVQAGGQMTRSLNTVLGNIDAVRAAAGTDPTSPTGNVVRDNQENIGNEQRSITSTASCSRPGRTRPTPPITARRPRMRCSPAMSAPRPALRAESPRASQREAGAVPPVAWDCR